MMELLIISVILEAIYILYLVLNRDEISIETALKYLKKNVIRSICFFYSNYTASDQIALSKSLIDQIDIKKVPKEQLKLFKEYIENL